MRALLLSLAVAALAAPVAADTLVAARTMRAQTILGPDDVERVPGTTPGAMELPGDAIGQEARVNLYAGRPILWDEVGPPAIVDRNAIVALNYARGGLTISTEGRSLGRGGVGDQIRVMNLASRSTVTGIVREDGGVWVTGAPPTVN